MDLEGTTLSLCLPRLHNEKSKKKELCVMCLYKLNMRIFFFHISTLPYRLFSQILPKKKNLSTYMEQQNRIVCLPQELTCTLQRLELLKIYVPGI